jgi:hypothetical protein
MRAPLTRLATATAVLAALVLALPLAACSSAKPGPPLKVPTKKRPPARRSHVFMIVMENKEAAHVVGSPNAPYFNKLARRYARPRGLYGIRHPSLPNYLALMSGDTHGITGDCTSCHVNARSLPDQLEETGQTWRGYMEDMPRACYGGAGRKGYAKKHNPFMYFDAIRGSSSRCKQHDVPYTALSRDLFKRKLADFSFISPNLCDDTHDCGLRTGDRFLAHLVPALLKEVGPHGFLIVTYDEGETNASCCGGVAHGGRVATVIAGPDVRRGATPQGPYSHYSTLRTLEDAFGLLPLGHAGDPGTLPLDAAFTTPPRLRAAAPR